MSIWGSYLVKLPQESQDQLRESCQGEGRIMNWASIISLHQGQRCSFVQRCHRKTFEEGAQSKNFRIPCPTVSYISWREQQRSEKTKQFAQGDNDVERKGQNPSLSLFDCKANCNKIKNKRTKEAKRKKKT